MLASVVRLPPPRRQQWLIRAARAAWTLPTNLIGWGLCLLLSGRRGTRVGGSVASGWTYPVRAGIGLDWIGAVTFGHHILHRRGMFDGPRGRLVLAHELAHTRQHDLLGPLYLPLHIACQAISFALSFWRGPVRHSRVHDHNPLEQTFIALAAGATDAWPLDASRAGIQPDDVLERFGV